MSAQALAVTTGGGLWLAYLRQQHVDRDLVLSCPASANGYQCRKEVRADRSTAEVVLTRVPTDGTPIRPEDIRWRTPVALAPLDSLAVDSRGNQLTLAFSSNVTPERTAIRYVVLDTTKL